MSSRRAESMAIGGHSGHEHTDGAWAPARWSGEDGLQLCSPTCSGEHRFRGDVAGPDVPVSADPRKSNMSWRQGSLWGLAGFASAVCGAGDRSAARDSLARCRQPRSSIGSCGGRCARSAWPAGSASSRLRAFGSKALGLLFLVSPYIVGAPQVDMLRWFRHTDPSVAQALVDLHQQFVRGSSTVANLVFWLSSGPAPVASLFNRWFTVYSR